MCFNQIFGIIGILIADAFIEKVGNKKYLTNVMSNIIFSVSFICVFFIEERLLRNEKENENKNKIIIENNNDIKNNVNLNININN